MLALKNFSSRQDYLNLVRLLNQNVPPETLLGVLDALLESRPDDPEALFAYSLAATGLGQAQRADKPSARLLELQPGVDEALLLRAQILLQSSQSQAASELLRGFLKTHPRHAQARLTLARVLLEEKDYAGARDAFDIVLKQDPANGDARLAAALLAGQLGDRRTARAQLLKLAGDEKRADQANFYLGKLAEDAGNSLQAIDRYARVKAGEHYLDALLRRANLLAQQGDLDAGVALLAAAASESDDNRTRLLLAQSDLLLQGNRALQAEALINEALAQEPDSMDLLFARSMVLDKLNRTAEMEQDLRRILEIDPKNANALNAWGYTLADRGERLDEAHTLISRALEQSPDNPTSWTVWAGCCSARATWSARRATCDGRSACCRMLRSTPTWPRCSTHRDAPTRPAKSWPRAWTSHRRMPACWACRANSARDPAADDAPGGPGAGGRPVGLRRARTGATHPAGHVVGRSSGGA